jgi:hypothetical protein
MLLLATLLPGVLLLAACGGSDSSEATSDGGTTAQTPPETPPAGDELVVTVDGTDMTCEQMAQLPDCGDLQPVFDDYAHNMQAFMDNGELGSFGRMITSTVAHQAALTACYHLRTNANDPEVALYEQLEGDGFTQSRAEMVALMNSAGEHLCPPDDDNTTSTGEETSP